MQKKMFKIFTILFAFLIVFGIVLFFLVWNGVILLNGFSAGKYSVRGIDVSSYQGNIDWAILSKQHISFAFIKATEGSTYVDEQFFYNYEEAQKTGIAVGAYHFFSYDSEGKTQAENFMNTVKPYEGMLPPVIDLEFYGDYEKNPPDREHVGEQLEMMLHILEDHYKQKPIIYATEKSYDLYLSGDYEEYDIWIRNVISKPKLSDNRQWTFWQYTNREQFYGYTAPEKYIDMNVFNGSTEAYNAYLKNNTFKK